jgi:hypothetical protein
MGLARKKTQIELEFADMHIYDTTRADEDMARIILWGAAVMCKSPRSYKFKYRLYSSVDS